MLLRRVLLGVVGFFPIMGLAAQAPKVRDSAGVHIIENGSRARLTATFTLAATPTEDYGGLKEKPEEEFAGGHYFGYKLVKLTNGATVMTDWYNFRFFNAQGKQT